MTKKAKKNFLIIIISIVFLSGSILITFLIINRLLPQKIVSQREYIKMDLPTLTKESDVIVLGTVEKVLPAMEKEIKIVVGEEAAEEARRRGEEDFTIVEDKKAAEEIKKEGKLLRRVYTDKVVKVDEYIRNPQTQKEIIVREEGGKIGNKTWLIAGQTPLKVGDRVILFLSKTSGAYSIIGGPQGKYYVQGDRAISEFGEGERKANELVSEIKSVK